ncbi:LytTR family DNA-binding domain-containing protein [Puia sp.]|jgi:DNA-binding LytR/AlgR family response regulator|uniref:LytR/AlgR family response regulator transcription factor n=1 Tax=Puia sp. TaxID=2045100 RepID=UPI002F404DB7
MSKIKCIIIEDEPLAVKVLVDYIGQVPFLELQATFKDAILATEWLRKSETGLIFLDIHLPKLKGMAFLRTLLQPPAVIITTAYHQYAVAGFELNVTDYLLKPVEFERFLVAVNKVRTAEAGRTGGKGEEGDPRDYIFVPVQKRKVRILLADILYIESQREYVRIRTTQGEYLTKMSTHEIEELLPAHLFRRVHRSFIVAIRRIESYTAEMIEMGGVSIPIGKGYRDGMERL